MQMDLNADLGEGVGDDDALLAIVTSANIATGAHAGGGEVLARAVAASAAHRVAIGAHPSYRDRAGFGRASHLAALRRDPDTAGPLVADLTEQIMAVGREAERHGRHLTHVKAHGALYNEAVRDPLAARVVADAVRAAGDALGYPVAVLTQPGGQLARTGEDEGLRVVAEGFADRGYTRAATLVPRGEVGALLPDVGAMVTQALALAGGHVDPVDGPRVPVSVESLCVHGDTPGAVAAARAIRAALESGGWEVASPFDIAPGRGGGGRAGGLVVRPFGDRGLLVEPADEDAPGTGWVLRVAALARRRWPRATVVPGLASVLVAFDRPGERPGRGECDLELGDGEGGHPRGPGSGGPGSGGRAPVPPAPAGRTHVFETRYDGPDLVEVAELLGLPVEEVVRRHSGAVWTVAAIGFSPGFGYLTCADPTFESVVRRADPRPRVCAGSVALAAGMCAVYPSATPGGWQLIGTTTAVLFDSAAERPALLRPGDLVRFRELG